MTNEQGYDTVPESQQPAKNTKQRRLNILFTVLSSVMVIAIGFLVYILLTERQEAEEMQLVLEMKENLTSELNDLYLQYDSLQTENDSMNLKIEAEQQKIRNLLSIRESNAKKIQLYEAELKTMREVMRSFVRQVDSLNRANLELRAENQQVKNQIREAESINRQLETNLRKEQEKVETASVVKTSNIIAEPIMDNGTLARRTKRTDKFKVCCTVNENPLADQGPKTIYLRIANPDDRVMALDVSQVFELEGETLV